MKTSQYQTWIFDCDGVILDSNSIKTETFYEVCLPYGKENAETFVSFHRQKGGVSRYEKLRYFFEHIIKKEDYRDEMDALLNKYGSRVKEKLLSAPVIPGVIGFLQSLPKKATKIVVTGGDQQEIRDIFKKRGLDRYFDGIFGSPDNKATIISMGIKEGIIVPPAIYFGDSRLDYEVAKDNGFAFVFLSGHSEFSGWEGYFADKKDVLVIRSFLNLAQDVKE